MKKLLLLPIVLLAVTALNAQTIYVDSSASGTGTGASWANAYTTLSNAFAQAASDNTITEILVAKGTYYPTGVQSGTNQDSTFLIRQSGGIKVLGGYPTGGGARDYSANPTLLSSDIGTINNNSDNNNHIMTIAGVSSNADSIVIDGFGFTGGNVVSIYTNNVYTYNGIPVNKRYGAGIAVYSIASNKLAIRNCVFNNIVASSGGVITDSIANPEIYNCTFQGNSTTTYLWAIDNYSSTPIISECSFNIMRIGVNNTSSNAVINNCSFSNCVYSSYNTTSNAMYDSCTFSNNRRGIYNLQSTPTINNSLFSDNTNYSIDNNSSSASLLNCRFIGNSKSAVYNNNSSPTFTDCLFAGNTNNLGAGMYNSNSSPTIINCTFSGNNAVGGSGGGGGGTGGMGRPAHYATNYTFGGGIYNQSSSNPTIVNSIFWGNSSDIYDTLGSTTNITYSDVEDSLYAGAGNISSDPLFTNAPLYTTAPFTVGDYSLQNASPAINAGNNNALPSGITTDLNGDSRIQNGTIDLGSYESSYTVVLPLKLISFTGNTNNCKANLQWVTYDEQNMIGFELQQSDDGKTFSTIADITAQNGTNNTYTKSLPLKNNFAFYRLKLVENDNNFTYSHVLKLTANCNTDPISLYPNPTNENVNIQNATIGSSYQLFNAVGELIAQGQINKNHFQVSTSGLASGLYFIKVNENDEVTKLKFIKK